MLPPQSAMGALWIGSCSSCCFGGRPRKTEDVFQGVQVIKATSIVLQQRSGVSLRTALLRTMPAFVKTKCSSVRPSLPAQAP